MAKQLTTSIICNFLLFLNAMQRYYYVSRHNDIHKGRHKCFTLIHDSISNSEKKMYYTRMLLARCNNALMSGIIDSFFYVKVHVEGEKKLTLPKVCVRTETERNQIATTVGATWPIRN